VEEERLTVKVSSVIGRTFQRPLVREVHPSRPAEPDLAHQLERLEETAFVALEEAAPAWRYAFQHAILHEVTYGTLLFAQRRQLHGEIGGVLERWNVRDLPRVLDLLAYHYARSEEREKAVHYLQRAAEKARREYANEVALGYYSQALERLLPEEQELRYDLLAGRERVYDLQGDREAQEQDLLSLARLAEKLASRERQAEVLNRSARRAADVGMFQEAQNFAQQAWGLVVEQSPAGAAEVQRTMGIIHGILGEYQEALECFIRAEGLYREQGDRLGETSCLINLGLVLLYQGNTEHAQSYLSRALELAQVLENRLQENQALINLGLAESLRGSYEHALAYVKSALAISREIGSSIGQEFALDSLGVISTALGNLTTAQEYHQEALRLSIELQDREGEAASRVNLGLLAAYQGTYEQARADLENALEQYQQMGHRRGEANALHYLALVALWIGESDAAHETFHNVLALRQEIGETANARVTQTWLAVASLAAGKPEEARTLIQEACTQLVSEGYSGDYPEQEIWWAAYRVWRALGQDAQAQEALQRAHGLVQEQADRIQDPALRRSFLENVPVNREIMQAYGQAQHGEVGPLAQ